MKWRIGWAMRNPAYSGGLLKNGRGAVRGRLHGKEQKAVVHRSGILFQILHVQPNNATRLPPEFYQTTDVVQIARDLLGKVLVTHFDGQYTAGRITETEAYRAPDDRACHAWNNRLTPRTRVMFEPGGTAYVYLCYGIHHLFNVVTAPAVMAHAVLIRAF